MLAYGQHMQAKLQLTTEYTVIPCSPTYFFCACMPAALVVVYFSNSFKTFIHVIIHTPALWT